MRKVSIPDAPRAFLVTMEEALVQRIGAGETHNADGVSLAELLGRVQAQIPVATEYAIEHGRGR